MSSNVYAIRDSIRYDHVRKLLRSPKLEKLSTKPPRGVIQANSVYVYKVPGNTRTKFWLQDGRQWDNRGSITHPKEDPWMKRQNFQLIRNKIREKFNRIVYTPFGFPSEKMSKDVFIIVYYKGCNDVPTPIPLQHGNRKMTPLKKAVLKLRELQGRPSPNKTPIPYTGRDYSTPSKQTARKRTGAADPSRCNKNLLDKFSGSQDDLNYFIFGTKGNPVNQVGNAFTPTMVNDPSGNGSEGSNTIEIKDVINSTDPGFRTEDHQACLVSESDQGIENTETEEQRTFITRLVNSVDLEDQSPGLNSTADLRAIPGYKKTDPAVIEKSKDLLQANVKPGEAYRQLTVEGYIQHGLSNPEKLPRNKKQMYNIKYRLQAQQRHDSLYEVYLFAVQNPDIVLKINLFPEVIIVQQHPELSAHVASLGGVLERVVYHYDTTFNIGKYFTSILTLRHCLFKDEPLIQVAIMLHETTAESSHATFFKTVAPKLGLNSSNVIIVTDRERSVRNAIRQNVNNATNLFCWNHIQKNVEVWAKKHEAADKEWYYKNQIRSLLQSSTLEDYMAIYEANVGTGSEKFRDYYHKFLEADLKTSFRFQLEKLNVYNQLSGMTNNAAESTNASIKSTLDYETMDFHQIVFKLFFYQVAQLVDIQRGLYGGGQFLLNLDAVPTGIYIPKDAHDVVDPNLIPYMAKGKLPPDSLTMGAYPIPSLPETTTIRGLAKLIIAKNKIDLLPHRQVFVVTGLLDKKYLVSVKDKTCTCLRPTICEHRLAAYMSLGLSEQKSYQKRCRPNLTNLYKKTIKKSTGTKCGQGNRPRIIIPKTKPRIVSNSANLTINKSGKDQDDAQTQIPDPTSQGVSSEILFKMPVIVPLTYNKMELENQPFGLPVLKKGNCSLTFLKLPTGAITYADIKTAELKLQMAETRLLAKQFGFEYSGDNQNYMVDPVISGFFFRLCESTADTVFLTAAETVIMWQGVDTWEVFSRSHVMPGGIIEKKDVYSWEAIERVLVPYNQNGSHWILLVVYPKIAEIQVYDPVDSFKLTEYEMQNVVALFRGRYPFPENQQWVTKYPDCPHSFGKNALQCGPYICFYAEAILKGWNLATMPDVGEYRNHVINVLLGKCKEALKTNKNVCSICKLQIDLKSDGLAKCEFCGIFQHMGCLSKTKFRGGDYNTC